MTNFIRTDRRRNASAAVFLYGKIFLAESACRHLHFIAHSAIIAMTPAVYGNRRMRNPQSKFGSARRKDYARSVHGTESQMSCRCAPTCEKRVNRFRFAAQADVFFMKRTAAENFFGFCKKNVVRARKMVATRRRL